MLPAAPPTAPPTPRLSRPGSFRPRRRWRRARWLILPLLGLIIACQSGPANQPPRPSPAESPAAPPIAASPNPPALAASPSPSPLPARLVAGELPPDSATLTYVPQGGFQTTLTSIQASCNRAGDSLGLLGMSLQGPVVARYQISIAPFHGNGRYRTGQDAAEIGGSISVSGLLQLYIGPPFETFADVANDGALGQLSYSGTGIDGRAAAGVIHWECSEVKPLA